VTDDRDRQRSKVYAWEESFVAPCDPSSILFAQAQGMVDAIWAEIGLRFPPKVEPLPRQDSPHGGRRQSTDNPVGGYQPVLVAVA